MKKILIVDDTEIIRQSLRDYLREDVPGMDEIYELIEAPDAVSAITQLTKKDFNLVISDLRMPGMNGLELLEALRQNLGSDVPFILYTSSWSEVLAERAKDLGALDCLDKLGDITLLFGRIRSVIAEE